MSAVMQTDSSFPNRLNLSTCTWGSGETWTWTAGRSGWSWLKVLRRQRAWKKVEFWGSGTTSRVWHWRATEPLEPEVPHDDDDDDGFSYLSVVQCYIIQYNHKTIILMTDWLSAGLNPRICSVSVFMNYFDNPGGMIPTWLVNWAAKVSVILLDSVQTRRA